MSSYLLVFGAGVGGDLRHGVTSPRCACSASASRTARSRSTSWAPSRSALLTGWFALKADPGQSWRLFLTSGMLGGFTTFSTFSLDAALLWEKGHLGVGALYVLTSVALAVLGLRAGLLIVRHLA